MRAPQGPLIFATPVILPHHVDLYLRHVFNAVVHSFQPMVKPSEVQTNVVIPSITELPGTDYGMVGRGLVPAMRRRRDDDKLILPCPLTYAVFLNEIDQPECIAYAVVVPRIHKQRRHVELIDGIYVTQRAPPRITFGVRHQ